MKCNECKNADVCIDHQEIKTLQGCTSGIPDRKIPTNADMIRNMSDEDLTELLYDSCLERMHIDECPYDDNDEMCKNCIAKWLKSTAHD